MQNIDLMSNFTVADGDCFHECLTWSTVDFTVTVYLNGELIGSRVTRNRELRPKGRACIGNMAVDENFLKLYQHYKVITFIEFYPEEGVVTQKCIDSKFHSH
jgi:hypothetical protein